MIRLAFVFLTSCVWMSGLHANGGIWISQDEVMNLPMEGEAWDYLWGKADESTSNPNISNQNDNVDVYTLAKGLVFARTGDESFRQEVIDTCMAAMETENGGRTLALGRNLIGYILAADLVGLPASEDELFRNWLDGLLNEVLDGKTLKSTHEDRPNNWGTHAGASRLARAIYLGDDQDLQAAIDVFHGWLGNHNAYNNFEFSELWWQCDPENPVGINPVGCTIEGHNVDGVLPDDQRRGGPFTWPPPQENYVYEALQGSIAQATLISNLGYDVWDWENQALLRAYVWLHEQANFPAEGDDRWQPHLVNHFYGTNFPAEIPAQHGKNVGFTDWTHAGSPPICEWDLDNDGSVGTSDFLILLNNWGQYDTVDLLELLAAWGSCS